MGKKLHNPCPIGLMVFVDPAFIQVREKPLNIKLQPSPNTLRFRYLAMGDGLKHGDIRFVWLLEPLQGLCYCCCINFYHTFSTAKTANRAKEVWFVKTVGEASKSNLVCAIPVQNPVLS